MKRRNLLFLSLIIFFMFTSACSFGRENTPAEAPSPPPASEGRCGDGSCAGPETSQSCPEDCPETEDASEPIIPPTDLPASVFVVHCEPTNANQHMWIKLVELVDLADSYHVPLSIDFPAQWAEMVLDDHFKQKVVEGWLENGHEIGGHHHAYWATKERSYTWDGYTNTPTKEIDPKDQKNYLGTMDDYMELLNALPGERTSGAMGTTGSPQDKQDWPCQLLYGTTGYALEDAVSQPQETTIGNCRITQIGHTLIVPQEGGALAELYANTVPDSIFGVVGHVFNYDEFPTAFEEWFKFLHEQDPSGERRSTVTALLEDWDANASDTGLDKWSLWVDGPHLRGANIYQRRVYPELDGPEFMGPGPLGPPYTQEDFDKLASWGANYVNISHPGIFSEETPYTLDEEVQANLDELLGMIEKADMFAVISFRTGPGRSEFGVCCLEDAGDWYDESYLNDEVWVDEDAQIAWTEMWHYTAERYRDNKIVVGYDLMVEPNSNEIWLDEWDHDVFYEQHGGTLYDWNQLFPRITQAIREADTETPILIGGMGYSAADWMPYLEPTGDPRTVYTAHQYAPHNYTHQGFFGEHAYPGMLDTDWDGEEETFDQDWLEDEVFAVLGEFATQHQAPVAVNEFGVVRWVPGGAEFVADQMALFEEQGINYALWQWESSWPPIQEEIDAFNFRHGPDPYHHEDVASSDLIEVIKGYWGLNTVRPSGGN